MAASSIEGMPTEQPQWSNSTGYHCASFVVELWRAAGLFGKMSITPNEFHVRDVYQVLLANEAAGSSSATDFD